MFLSFGYSEISILFDTSSTFIQYEMRIFSCNYMDLDLKPVLQRFDSWMSEGGVWPETDFVLLMGFCELLC